MTRVAILGATGYSGLELLKLLVRHPHVEIVAVTSRQDDQPPIAEVHPILQGQLELNLENIPPQEAAARADCVFCCYPHGLTSEVVPQVLQTGAAVIDLSADYRLRDPAVYQQWYQTVHRDPENLPHAVYGLAELNAPQIKTARLIANPGCYPTSAILGLAPFVRSGLVEGDSIIIDSKSGVSGAGRTPKLATLYAECNENVAAYSVGGHRHTPEIEQILSDVAGTPVSVLFTPHLIPMDRGILSTIYAQPARSTSEEELLQLLQEAYSDKPFVRVSPRLPATKHVAGTNFCDLTVRLVRGRVLIFSCLDNLIKGAAGAAVQNMNLIFDYPETTALL